MDTSTRQRFWEIVGHLKEQGVTIVYSSHYIEEVEHTADRILVLHQGHLLRDTTPLAMRSEEVEKHFTLPLRYQALVAEMEGIGQVIGQTRCPSGCDRRCQSFVDCDCKKKDVRSKKSK